MKTCCPECGALEGYRHSPGCRAYVRRDPPSEAERHAAFDALAQHLPPVDVRNWTWTNEETEILRKACAARFDESLRTESLFKIAVAGMRIAMARGALVPTNQPMK